MILALATHKEPYLLAKYHLQPEKMCSVSKVHVAKAAAVAAAGEKKSVAEHEDGKQQL